VGFKILKSGITRRWILNILSITVALISVLVVAASFLVHNYYISSARQELDNKAEIDVSYFSQLYSSQTELLSGIKAYTENFPQKNKIELMVASSTGKIILTSSGFAPDTTNPSDATEAIADGSGFYTGENAYGENILAVSRSLKIDDQVVCVLRYVISTQNINIRIWMVILLLIGFGAIFILANFFSGRYFMRSIINPITKITETTKVIAKNDFSVRINEEYPNEIGALATEINNMAAALGASETMKNEFTSSISHELLTPLTAIRGWSETLSDPNMRTSEMVDKGMKVISNESVRLSAMVEELLDFSRLQSGRMTLNMAKLDLIAELEESVMMFEERAKKNNISLLITSPETCSPVLGDSSRMKQVFVNIIDNAIKYSSPEGGKIEINLFENKNSVCILFADDGIGIAAEDLPHVKQKFFKFTSARPGSGIGLAIVNEIVNLHGGKFDIDSIYGKGTTVMLSFPTIQLPEDRFN